MKLSIITIAYNNLEGLKRTLQTVANQSYDDFEQIVIDGGSKDGSLDVIKSYEGLIPNYKWVSEPDKGIYDAMNKGIRLAKGKIIVFINADDEIIAKGE